MVDDGGGYISLGAVAFIWLRAPSFFTLQRERHTRFLSALLENHVLSCPFRE
jgi:hypothetical protein